MLDDVNALIGTHDVAMITLDSLRYDVAAKSLADGRTPHLKAVLPGGEWEKRHSPGTFTLAAHQAFFAGFTPTPAAPGGHRRPFAVRFAGSKTIGKTTCVFDAPDIVRGLAMRGYHTVCIGGVGFFNPRTALGSVLPSLFAESHWNPTLGVTNRASTEHQVALAARILAELPAQQRVFLFVNISAIHSPTHFYLPGAKRDSLETHAAALDYVDEQLPPLFAALGRRGPAFVLIGSDHGEAFGEDGFYGHRLAHPTVTTVPWAEFVLPATSPA